MIERISSFWTTLAWPDPTDPPFTNAVVQGRSYHAGPGALLDALLAVEQAFGRQRSVKNAPRTLDLDILDYDGHIQGEEGDSLILPHPRMHDRLFVMGPLAEIAPHWRHPVIKATALELAETLSAKAEAGN